MKHLLHKVRLLPLLIIMLLTYSSIHSSDSNWDLKIELSKPEYVLHEPVWLDVTIINNTSDTLRTYGLIHPNHFHFHIVLTDGAGKEMEYTGRQSNVIWGTGELLLDAAEEDYDSFNLTALFGSGDCNSGYKLAPLRFPCLPRGTYTVRVSYEGDISNDLAFDIVDPNGQEKTILRKIEEANRIWRRADTDPSSQMYGEVPREYPNSPFAEMCYYLYRVYANNMEGHISRGSKAPLFHRELLREYPNSGHAKEFISSITFGKSDDEKTAIYNELIAENPDTRASKIASLLKKRMLAKREGEK